MGVFKDAWDAKKKAEAGLQDLGARGVRPVIQAIAHIPAAMFSTPGLPQKKKKQP